MSRKAFEKWYRENMIPRCLREFPEKFFVRVDGEYVNALVKAAYDGWKAGSRDKARALAKPAKVKESEISPVSYETLLELNLAASSAVAFALKCRSSGPAFLEAWFSGDYATIKKLWPRAPASIYVGQAAISTVDSQQEVASGLTTEHR